MRDPRNQAAGAGVLRAMNRAAGLLLGLTLFLAACAAPGASPGEEAVEHPTGDALVFSVEMRGGFVPAEFLATNLPSFALFGDGRVITQGAMTMIFPGPALPPIQVRTLTEAGIQQILDGVLETGLFDADLELRGAANFVADAGDTVFTLHADGREVTVSVYALGFLDPSVPQQGISAAEVSAHQVLSRLNEQLLSLDQWLPAEAFADEGWQAYEPEAFRLYVRNADADVPDAGGLPPEAPRAWPLDGDPAAFGEEEPFFGNGTRCGVVEGEEAATWFVELSAATQLTRWTDGEHLYAISPRPLLPYEEHVCPQLGAGA